MEILVATADVCQSATLALCLSAYIPQWRMLYKTRSSKNVSIKSWLLWLVSAVCSCFYAIVQYQAYGTGLILVATSTISLSFICFTIVLLYRFRPSSILTNEAITNSIGEVLHASESAKLSLVPTYSKKYAQSLLATKEQFQTISKSTDHTQKNVV